jgi:hypothetical protein
MFILQKEIAMTRETLRQAELTCRAIATAHRRNGCSALSYCWIRQAEELARMAATDTDDDEKWKFVTYR